MTLTPMTLTPIGGRDPHAAAGVALYKNVRRHAYINDTHTTERTLR